MNVRLTADTRKILTWTEEQMAKEVIKAAKEDTTSAKEALQMAANLFGHCDRVVEARAEIAGNCRVSDWWGEGTGKLDVWVTGLVHIWDGATEGYIEIGAYYSDINDISGDKEYMKILKSRMYVRKFNLVRP